MWRKIVIACLIPLICTACGAANNPRIDPETTPLVILTPEPTAAESGLGDGECQKIALVIADGVNRDIYTVCPDGSRLTNLTAVIAGDSDPAWSPDGARIAFTSDRDGSSQIYVMDADGKYPMELTSDHINDNPVWLPDGESIAFRTHDGAGMWWWRIVELTSSAVTDYSAPSYDFFFQTPAWSPDGSRLAYMSLVEQQARNDGSSQLHVKVLPNRSDTALTSDIWANINPVWSPDGEKIAFFSERDGTYNLFALYVINADGSGLERVTDPIYSENASASWSPDGKWLVVGGNDYLNTKVVIINIESKEVLDFLELSSGLWASDPDWQPDN